MTTFQPLADAEDLHSLLWHRTLMGGQGKAEVVTTHRLDAVVALEHIERLMPKLAQSGGQLFRTVSETPGAWRVSSSPLGRSLMTRLFCTDRKLPSRFPKHELHPYLKLYFYLVCLGQVGSELISMKLDENMPLEAAQYVESQLNAFVDAVRRHCNSKAFRKAVKAFHHAARRTERNVQNYVCALFEARSRMLVIRIDLTYKHDLEAEHDTSDAIGFETVYADKGQILKYLSKKYGKALLGYVWKIEFGWLKGFHNHVLLFLDAKLHMNDILIAKGIGEYWTGEVTGGQGLYFNCNAEKEKYEHCGIGEVKYHDVDALCGLQIAVRYMCKSDYLVRGVLPRGARAMTKGGMPKHKGEKRGPKRQHELHWPDWKSLTLDPLGEWHRKPRANRGFLTRMGSGR
ncbi:MAG: inovirus-type Gp2 protein [Curvibacter lanceolatus]|uniref:YagK/YfjJ domain-containing protein n=1 Tax=Curvibacter lanceolatus TaxID=86182 RepID=UPI0003634BFB|nr:inovirus-type Gp2 protein [Curvibacter lanceolatus]MBV5292856.1 inovirus-type Gp2 protein [Curvibacter lanceolatus]